MHLSQPNYQLTSDQITTRDTAQLYLKIEQNTQYLTNLFRHQIGRQRPIFNIEMQQVQIRSFFHVIIQASYLMYTCTIRKVSLFLSRQLFIQAYRDSSPEIVLEFLLQKELLNMSEQKQKYLQKAFHYINPYKYQNAYASNLLGFIKNIIQIMKAYLDKHKDKKIIGDKILMRQIQTFIDTIAIIQPQISRGIKPKILISCLQETQVFRVYSALLKTLNSSMYQCLRKTQKLKQIISDIKREQIKFNEHLNSLKRDNNFNQQQSQLIETQVQNFLNFLEKSNLISFDLSASFDSNCQNKSKFQKNVQIMKDGQRIVKFSTKIEIKPFHPFTQQLLYSIESGQLGNCSTQLQKKKYSYFQIQLYPNRRLICVKYISQIQISIQNTDVLMYHCNNMMMGWQNASMEQVEKKKSDGVNKKRQKFIAFKVLSQFHSKDSPFINILLGLDMALIYGKISEPELTQKVVKIDDHNKFVQAGKKIDHLMSLFIKKIKRLYESIPYKQL